jgi:diaminopimelate decarboxylase
MPSYHYLSQARLLPDTMTVSPDGMLELAGHALTELAKQYGTPLYIYDRETIIDACVNYWQAFREYYRVSPVRIIYASKAYLSPLLAQLLTEQGLGLDVVSGGELLVAQRARVPMGHVSFHGNNKSDEELYLALQLGVGRIVLDNWSELERLTRIAKDTGRHPSVLLRVAPDIATDTHRYLQTGHAAAKFGFPLFNGEAKAAILRILHDGCLHLAGLHAHVGTMLKETRPYEECLERLFTLAAEVYQETQWWPEEVSPGGGWAIDTAESDPVPGVEVLAQALQHRMQLLLSAFDKPAPTLIIEPGRSLVARAGVALYRVGARKATPGGVIYLFVNGGMADNIRPALYGAKYTALAVEQATAEAKETVCLSGRYCESGDILIEHVDLPRMQEGNLVLLPTAGAYCLPMASNYNLVPRPSVIIVDKFGVQTMELRETYDSILARYPII